MIDDYPDTLAALIIHDGDDHEVPWGTARDAFYGAAWTPFSCHDGLQDAWPIATYESKFLARQATPTDVTIDLDVLGSGATRTVNATICIEPGGTGKTMDVFMAQALDHASLYPDPGTDRNQVRTGSAGAEITLAAGACTVVSEELTLDADSQAAIENVKFFAWAQDIDLTYNPKVVQIGTTWYGAWFGEVYQAAKSVYPFAFFDDGFESGDTSGWSDVTP